MQRESDAMMAKLAGLQAAVQAAMSADGAVGRGGCKFCNARLEELNRRLEAARNSTAAQNAFLNEDRHAPACLSACRTHTCAAARIGIGPAGLGFGRVTLRALIAGALAAWCADVRLSDQQ